MYRVSLVITAMLVAILALSSVFAAPATSFSGQATLVRASVLGINVDLGDTGPLPAAGGNLSTSVASLALPPLPLPVTLSAGVGQSQTSGQGNQSHSSALLTNLDLNVLGIPISAAAVRSQAEAHCAGGQAAASGKSELADLVIAGQHIAAAAPNLSITLPLGIKVVVNEQTSSTSGASGESTANALHVTVAEPAIDVVVASSHADITCDKGQPQP